MSVDRICRSLKEPPLSSGWHWQRYCQRCCGCKYKVFQSNPFLNEYITQFLKVYANDISKTLLIKDAFDIIERNDEVFKYSNVSLYSHQKEVFGVCKRNGSKLILYQAPTGTGKTLTPLGLVKKHKIIFVCAAKHVGMQLAKSCISLEIPIAVAFGCKDPGDIRLHYFAAKDFTKNRRTGGIWSVDNSVGDKVEIIISDIQSYQSSMYYMLSFNEKEELLWYWDEPTITLDYEDHEYHKILKDNWDKNVIPNIILSSATLPKKDKISPCIMSFNQRFPDNTIYTIESTDCKKTIPLISKDGYVVMPHYLYKDYGDLKKCSKHLTNYKTLMRHLDVKELSKFIYYINENKLVRDNLLIDNYFESIEEIDILSIKKYYLDLLGRVKKNWSTIYEHFQKKQKKKYDSVVRLTTNDSYTLTDGPTMFITNKIERVSMFYLKVSQISQITLDRPKTVKKTSKLKKLF